MYLLRCLVFITKHFGIQLEIISIHCPGQDNVQADALSQNKINVIASTGFHLGGFSSSRHSTQTVKAAGS